MARATARNQRDLGRRIAGTEIEDFVRGVKCDTGVRQGDGLESGIHKGLKDDRKLQFVTEKSFATSRCNCILCCPDKVVR